MKGREGRGGGEGERRGDEKYQAIEERVERTREKERKERVRS